MRSLPKFSCIKVLATRLDLGYMEGADNEQRTPDKRWKRRTNDEKDGQTMEKADKR